MIESFLILATEAHHAEKGFGLNFDILEANLINLAILVGVLLYFAPKVLGKVLSERRNKIAEAIQEAEDKQKQAAAALAEQQQKLAQAKVEAERIVRVAQEKSTGVAAEIASKAEQDVERMRATAAADISAEQERIITQLRKQIAAMALEQAETHLKTRLGERTQQTLIERSLAQLGGRSSLTPP